MDKQARAELLRLRFKAKGGVPYVPSGKPRRYRHNISGKPVHMSWPQIEANTKRAPGWMFAPNPKLKLMPRPKRDAGTSALTKIAEKTPKKLARNFASAEAFLTHMRADLR